MKRTCISLLALPVLWGCMLGETKNQFSLTSAAPSTCGREKSKFLSVLCILGIFLLQCGCAYFNPSPGTYQALTPESPPMKESDRMWSPWIP